MELWIRSQDREYLTKVKDVYIEEILNTTIFITDKYNVGEWLIESKDTILGCYKTKERALEVLDEIQKYINNNCEFIERKTHTKMGTYTNKIDTNVYEMPKE